MISFVFFLSVKFFSISIPFVLNDVSILYRKSDKFLGGKVGAFELFAALLCYFFDAVCLAYFVQCYSCFWTVLGRFWLDMVHTGFFPQQWETRLCFFVLGLFLVAGFIFPFLFHRSMITSYCFLKINSEGFAHFWNMMIWAT